MIKYYVISHTHWDREWYQPLEVMKLRLVDLIDYLLEILKKDSTYIFHLDEQTVVLEDYLSVRPENEKILKKYIKSKNIFVGPWYLQNDFYFSSGETTIRNLHYGIEIANEFGYANKAGYAPDNFGIISQLPQILNGFQIDTFLFGRGYDRWFLDNGGTLRHDPRKAEFIWEGADNSRLYANYMKAWYNNAQRIPDNEDDALYMIKNSEDIFKGFNVTPYILLMNGVDHLEAQDNIKEVIEKINNKLKDNVIAQTDLETYLNSVKGVLENTPNPYVFKGELRQGQDYQLLKGCASSRIYLKTLNAEAFDMLEYKLEPLYSLLDLFGAKNVYSLDHFNYFWKTLLKQLPHDNICGCSCDQVNRHMEDIYERMEESTTEYYKRGLHLAVTHAKIKGETSKDYKICVINTTNLPRTALAKVQVDLPYSEHINSFVITDAEGKIAEYEILSKQRVQKDIISGLNLPGIIDAVRYELAVDVGTVNPYAVKTFLLKKGKYSRVKRNVVKDICVGDYTVKVNGNSLDLYYKNRVIKNFISFEDSYDAGDSYKYRNDSDKPYKLKYKLVNSSLTQSKLFAKAVIKYQVSLPKSFDFKKKARSSAMVNCPLELELLLEKNTDYLKINYKFENKAKNHRLRIVFSADFNGKGIYCDSPFDVVYRDGSSEHPFTLTKTYPNSSFVCMENKTIGLGVLTCGQHEVEHIGDKLLFTLVRANGNVNADLNGRTIGGSLWVAEENQCLRTISGSMAVALYDNNYILADLPNKAVRFRNELCTTFDSCDYKKFSGGRFAVQDAKLQYIYFRDDKYKNLSIKDNESAFDIIGEGLKVSCVKGAYDGDGITVRVYNYTNEKVDALIRFSGKIYLADMDEKQFDLLGENEAKFGFSPKKIITFKLCKK